MPIDLLIPFVILIVLVVYLIYMRNSYEKSIIELYENKYEEWKENFAPTEKKEETKIEFVGLVYKEDSRLNIEIFDEKYLPVLEAGKYKIKVR